MGGEEAGCVFCQLSAGQIPCQRVFENEHVLAFLDINPLSNGHTIVIPTEHAPTLDQLTAESVAQVARALRDLAPRIAAMVGAAGYNLLLNNGAVAGQVVPHVHFHIIPRRAGDGLGYRWKAQQRSAAQLAELAAQIASRR